jgi:hypothetical protein
MSALGHKRTFAVHQPMSALLPIADICGALAHVGFGPIADICLFDEHVHAAQKCFWNSQAEDLRSLEINGQLEFCWLLDRYVLRRFALKNFLHEFRAMSNSSRTISPE